MSLVCVYCVHFCWKCWLLERERIFCCRVWQWVKLLEVSSKFEGHDRTVVPTALVAQRKRKREFTSMGFTCLLALWHILASCYCPIQHSAVQCSAVHAHLLLFNPTQCSAVHTYMLLSNTTSCSAVQCSTVHTYLPPEPEHTAPARKWRLQTCRSTTGLMALEKRWLCLHRKKRMDWLERTENRSV